MARTFNGTTDKIIYTDVPQVGTGTISMWAYITNFPAASDRDLLFTFYNQSESESYSTYDKQLFVNSSGIFKARIYDGAGKKAATTTAISTGTWNHLLFTFDGSNLKIWLNGANEGTTAAGNSYTGYADPAVALSGLTFDVGDSETNVTRLDGALAEIGIWGSVLSDGDISALASAFSPMTVKTSNLVCYYPFVVSANNVVRSDTGTLTGTTASDHPRVLHSRRRVDPRRFTTAAGGGSVFAPYYYQEHIARAG